MIAYEIGDVIVYSTWSGGVRTVEVTGKELIEDTGRPGFVGNLLDLWMKPKPVSGGGHVQVWGYDDQIDSVEMTKDQYDRYFCCDCGDEKATTDEDDPLCDDCARARAEASEEALISAAERDAEDRYYREGRYAR